MARTKTLLILFLISLSGVLILSEFIWPEHLYFWISLFIIGTAAPFFIRFEVRHISGREVVLIGVLAAIAGLSRVPFSAFPSVQPVTFVIIVSSVVFGPESGFIIGTLSAFVSNLFLGQGPWTIWQMYAWGLIGVLAGFLGQTKILRSRIVLCVFGFLAGFLFGWIMNLWIILMGHEWTWSMIMSYYLSSFYFDLAHAISNVFFLALFGKSWIKILSRFKIKYRLLDDTQMNK
ncbi:ECF transporter S component [Terrilactibacillus laevilacticus]|uniref:ECF transporter S component n=1 Tax=Terrilactibacillus laevilacticus TaxID=1380157 RepID=A0ABW5PSZ6_9BACI|nr:ECF transporter S component [Terrilactibacillus laevilacticus]